MITTLFKANGVHWCFVCRPVIFNLLKITSQFYLFIYFDSFPLDFSTPWSQHPPPQTKEQNNICFTRFEGRGHHKTVPHHVQQRFCFKSYYSIIEETRAPAQHAQQTAAHSYLARTFTWKSQSFRLKRHKNTFYLFVLRNAMTGFHLSQTLTNWQFWQRVLRFKPRLLTNRRLVEESRSFATPTWLRCSANIG